jgi:uncharacterized membrane protein
VTESHPGTTGLDSRLAGVLCYSVWWVTGALFLLIERQDRTVRFHAAQSVVLFGAVSLLLVAFGGATALALILSGQVFQMLRVAGDLLWAAAAVLWLVLVLRAGRGDVWRVPLVAALADRVAARTGGA